MRIRQVKPDFWRDSRLAQLPDTARLVYVGLWMEADDSGWFRMELPEIALDLYPYQLPIARQRRVQAAIDRLEVIGRVQLHPCGHGFIPTLVRHQRFAAPDKRITTFLREHEECVPANTRGEPRGTAGHPQRKGKVKVEVEERVEEGNGGEIAVSGEPSYQDPDPTWAPFLGAWDARGLRPLTRGQRQILWGEGEDHGAVRDFPIKVMEWVQRAPAGAKPADVVGHVLRCYHDEIRQRREQAGVK